MTGELADDTLDELAEMDGWSIDGAGATFRPFDAGWSALVMYRTVHDKHHGRWHMSLIDPRRCCREVRIRTRLADARIVAEGRVRFENRPRAACLII